MSDRKEEVRFKLTDAVTETLNGAGLQAGLVLLGVINTRRAWIVCTDAAGE